MDAELIKLAVVAIRYAIYDGVVEELFLSSQMEKASTMLLYSFV